MDYWAWRHWENPKLRDEGNTENFWEAADEMEEWLETQMAEQIAAFKAAKEAADRKKAGVEPEKPAAKPEKVAEPESTVEVTQKVTSNPIPEEQYETWEDVYDDKW